MVKKISQGHVLIAEADLCTYEKEQMDEHSLTVLCTDRINSREFCDHIQGEFTGVAGPSRYPVMRNEWREQVLA